MRKGQCVPAVQGVGDVNPELLEQQTRELIAQLGHHYVDGNSTMEGWTYQPIPLPQFSDIPCHKKPDEWRYVEQLYGDWKDKRVLDWGCNIGWYCLQLSKLGACCIGIDYHTLTIQIAKNLAHLRGHTILYMHPDEYIRTTNIGTADVLLLLNVYHWQVKHLGKAMAARWLEHLIDVRQPQYLVFSAPLRARDSMAKVDLFKNTQSAKDMIAGITGMRCKELTTIRAFNRDRVLLVMERA